MDEKRLAELEALAKAATEGPWGTGQRERGEWEVVLPIPKPCSITGVPLAAVRPYRRETAKADAEFIAAARTAVPELAAALRQAWREMELMAKLSAIQLESVNAIVDREMRYCSCVGLDPTCPQHGPNPPG